MSTQQHLTTLGGLYIALGALNVLIALVNFVAMTTAGLLSGNAREVTEAVTSDVRSAVVSFCLLGAVLAFIGGFGLLKRKSWSWSLVYILSCMSLLSVPFGTAIGVYALWVLMRPETEQSLRVGANTSLMRRTIKITFALSLVLMTASYPACYLGEHAVQGELSKLSPAELQLHQFDMVYGRWVLPGVVMFLWGTMLAVVAIVSWLIERRRRVRQKASAGGER